MPSIPVVLSSGLCAALLVCLLGATQAPASGRTLVVDRASIGGRCDDEQPTARNGLRRPLCSIERAVALLPSGGHVLVRRGRYPALRIDGRRTANRLTIAARAGERPILAGFDVQRSARLRISGFRLSDISHVEDSDHVVVEENDATPHGFIAGGSSHLRFARNRIHDATIDMRPAGVPGPRCHTRTPDAGMAPRCGFGLRLNDVTDSVVAGNEIDHVPADGIQGAGLQRVEIHDNHFHDISAFVDPAEHSDGIQLLGTNDQVTIRRNRFQDTRGVLAHPMVGNRRWPGTTTRLVVSDNAFFRIRHWAMHLVDTARARITGNTVAVAGSGIRLTEHPEVAAPMRDVVLTGNVVSGLDATPGMVASSAGNLIGRGPLLGPTDRRGEPEYVDLEAGDLRRRGTAPVGAPDDLARTPPERWVSPVAGLARRRR